MRRRNAVEVENTTRRRVRCSGIAVLHAGRASWASFRFARPHAASLGTQRRSSALLASARFRLARSSFFRFHSILQAPAGPLL